MRTSNVIIVGIVGAVLLGIYFSQLDKPTTTAISSFGHLAGPSGGALLLFVFFAWIGDGISDRDRWKKRKHP
jgi:hypothetical protein